MLEFIHEFLLRSAVTVPLLTGGSIATWAILRKMKMMRLDKPFDAADMRTWPLICAMADAAIFALAFSAISSTLGDGPLTAAAAAGGAALAALGVVPLIAATRRR